MNTTTARDTRTTYRLPVDLDRHLTQLAEQQNVSKNTLVVGLLAGATAWRPSG